LIAFRHGLRASELCDLQWGQINFQQGTLLVQRVKNGTPSTHYLNGTELRALRRLQRENEPGRYVFVTERGGPVTTAWFRKMFARLGEAARIPFPIHPHMLRHSCGFKFANEGKDTRSLQGIWGAGTSSRRPSTRTWRRIGLRAGRGSKLGSPPLGGLLRRQPSGGQAVTYPLHHRRCRYPHRRMVEYGRRLRH
jgi:integrase